LDTNKVEAFTVDALEKITMRGFRYCQSAESIFVSGGASTDVFLTEIPLGQR
jgi:hypothetical protein